MTLRTRVEKLEAKANPDGVAYPVHMYELQEGQQPGHTRENCPHCAAMSDDEYARYCEWLGSQKGDRVLVLEIDC